MPSMSDSNDVLDVRQVGTDVTSKIKLTFGESVFCWVLTANTIALSVVAAFLPWYTEAALYTLPLIVVSFAVFVFIPDIVFLPYMKRNIARVEERGHSRTEWVTGMCFAMSLFGLFSWLPIRFFSCFAEAEARFTAEFFLKAIACAVASDLPFFPLHRILHHHLTKLHVMHHLCLDPSLAVTILIDPLDAIFEFLVPGSIVMLFTLGVMRDPWVHLGATAVMTAWYILAHDPQIKMQHYYHHAYCDSHYTGYVPLKTKHDRKDKIRAQMFAIRQQERDAAKKK